jgi:hypothetical protein
MRHSCTNYPEISFCDPHHYLFSEDSAMRHFSTARDILVPLAGVAFFVMLLTLVR